MEYGLRGLSLYYGAGKPLRVLILVLMEYGLRGVENQPIYAVWLVLILVLMEYGLRE